jgi:hypothetical protein
MIRAPVLHPSPREAPMRRPLRFGLFVPQGWILDLVAI